MAERIVRVPLPSGRLALFDPAVLAHRRTAEPGWVKDASAVTEEEHAQRLASFAAGEGTLEVHVPDAEASSPPASAQSAPVRVESGKLFLGDLAELPSRAWGKRRWVLSDWAFAAFVLLLVPFVLWMAGFDSHTLWFVGGSTVFCILLMVPISWVMFRDGTNFKRRTAVPPKDHPDRVLELPPGDYVVAWERKTGGDFPVVHLWFGLRTGADAAAPRP